MSGVRQRRRWPSRRLFRDRAKTGPPRRRAAAAAGCGRPAVRAYRARSRLPGPRSAPPVRGSGGDGPSASWRSPIFMPPTKPVCPSATRILRWLRRLICSAGGISLGGKNLARRTPRFLSRVPARGKSYSSPTPSRSTRTSTPRRAARVRASINWRPVLFVSKIYVDRKSECRELSMASSMLGKACSPFCSSSTVFPPTSGRRVTAHEIRIISENSGESTGPDISGSDGSSGVSQATSNWKREGC